MGQCTLASGEAISRTESVSWWPGAEAGQETGRERRGEPHDIEESAGQQEILRRQLGEHDTVSVGHAGEVWLC